MSDVRAQGQADEGVDVDAPRQGRRWLIRLAIAVVAALFVSMVGVLYYFSYLRQPKVAQALFVVEGEASHVGTVIRVHGLGEQALTQRIAAEQNHLCRFALPAGTYSVEVEIPGRKVERIPRLELKEYQYVGIRLLPLDQQKKPAGK